MSPTVVDVIPGPPCRVDASAHVPALVVGLRWLYDTEQPPAAIVDHRGRRLRSAGDRTVRFTPVGWQGRVVVVLIPTTNTHGRVRPVSAGELEAFADAVSDLGEDVVSTWSGELRGFVALSRPAHPSLRAAVQRYEDGCPDHGGAPACGCGWLAAGSEHVVGLTAVQKQVRAHAAALPRLAGAWPVDLDPTGQCAAIACRAFAAAPPAANTL